MVLKKIGDYISHRVYQKRKVTFWTSIGFGVSDMVGGGGQTIIGAWLLFFYTTYCNLSATQGALIVAIGKIISGTCGMLMGGWTDNFYRTKIGRRFGRRHAFMYFGAPLLLTFILMWVGGRSFWYYLIIYCVFDAASTISIPYETLPTEMTKNYDERTKISTARMFFSASATFFGTFLPGQLFRIMGTKSPMPFFINGLIFGILFVVAYYISAFSTWEHPVSEIAVGDINEKGSVGQTLVRDFKAYISTLKIKSFRQHLYIYLLSFTGKDVYNTVFTYFCVYVLGVSATLAANLLSLSIVGVVTTLIGGWLMVKFGPRFLYILSYGLMLLMYGGYFTVVHSQPSNIVTWLFIISFVYQIGRSLLEFTPWNVYPFIPDVDELVSGHNRAGVFASVISLTRNSTAAIATVLVGMFLDANGFVKNATTEPIHVQNAIMQAIFVGAGGLVLLALLAALTFKLNRHTHKVIIDEVKRLRDGGSKRDATEETKRITKQITGYDYSRVWPESPDTVNPPIVLKVDRDKAAKK